MRNSNVSIRVHVVIRFRKTFDRGMKVVVGIPVSKKSRAVMLAILSLKQLSFIWPALSSH